jgi:hypothetical protein
MWTHTTKLQVLRLPQQLLFKWWVVFWDLHHSVLRSFSCFGETNCLHLQGDWTRQGGCLKWCAERCVSYIGMLEAVWSITATGGSVTSPIPKMQVFSDVTLYEWITGSWHSEESMGPSSSGSSNNAASTSNLTNPDPFSPFCSYDWPNSRNFPIQLTHPLPPHLFSIHLDQIRHPEDQGSIFLWNIWTKLIHGVKPHKMTIIWMTKMTDIILSCECSKIHT